MKVENAEKESTVIELLSGRSADCDEFEHYTHPHAKRLASIADELARLFNLGREDRVSLRQACLAHDLGELTMGRDYIDKERSLMPDEVVDMQRHPIFGEQEAARFGVDRGAQLLIRWHHEWWNGKGYPDALRGQQIPLAARILRVADTFCALTDDRPYRRALSLSGAASELRAGAAIEFDPHVVKVFLGIPANEFICSYAQSDESPTGQPEESEEFSTINS